MADGLTSQEIADRLLMAKRTVEMHLVTVQQKLQTENRQQSLSKAISLGLVFPRVNLDRLALAVHREGSFGKAPRTPLHKGLPRKTPHET